jgi:threonine aldolase
MEVNLISDTFTKPSKPMYEAMMSAPVGDDVFGEDPTVNALEQKLADMFGMEAGLFTPSGTMANQIAIKAHTNPGERLICSSLAHIHIYEAGGLAFHSGLTTHLIPGDRGRMSATEIENALLPEDIHYPETTLVALEDTVNKGGGCYYRLNQLAEISALCKTNNLKLHVDGARIFNALQASGNSPKAYGKLVDSISICLSKGLGAPIGSVLIGSTQFIKEARRKRKLFGGGMRQVGVIAAAGIYALEHNIEKLQIDHKRAKLIEKELLNKPDFIKEVLPVETNIIIFEPVKGKEQIIADHFKKANIRGITMGKAFRFVTHLDLSDDDIAYTLKVISNL